MTRNGKDYTLTQEVLDEIATYMNDELEKTFTSIWLHHVSQRNS